MKKALLHRYENTDQGTVGELLFGDFRSHTLELPWRDNKKQRSCIPVGTYRLIWSRSPKFGMCYHVADVPGRSDVLVHAANFAGDVDLGWTSQLHGCIALATRIGFMKNLAGKMQLAGLVSKPALRCFESWGSEEDILLEIIGEQK